MSFCERLPDSRGTSLGTLRGDAASIILRYVEQWGTCSPRHQPNAMKPAMDRNRAVRHKSSAGAGAITLFCGVSAFAVGLGVNPEAVPAASGQKSDRIVSVEVIGTAFRVTLASGTIVEKSELEGATLALVLPGETKPKQVRIDSIVPDSTDPQGEVLLYRMTVVDQATGRSEELCEPDQQGKRWGFPLRGQWDANGRHISDEGFTLTCATGAQGKCVRFGYKPWKTLPNGVALRDYHQACVRLVRADYCGTGGTTKDGMLIDIYDKIGISTISDTADHDALKFEAAWDVNGAVCVAHTRVRENINLEGLATECPRLRGRLGETVCTRAAAESGAFGAALLYNRSR